MNSFRVTIMALAVAPTVALVSITAAEEAATDAPATGKEYVVFFGLDVFAKGSGGKFHPVVAGADREVLVMEEGASDTVPLRGVPLRAEVTPRLSRTSVEIQGLDGEPVHSPATNPMAASQSQMIALQNIQADRQEAAETAMRAAETAAQSAATNAAFADAQAPNKAELQGAAILAKDDAARAMNDMASLASNPDFRGFEPGTGAGKNAFDGLEVAFHIAASERVAHAWGALRVIVRSPQQPETKLQALKVFRLREISPDSRKVVVRVFGLPPGFSMDSYNVHVFADGEELATNLSPNRVELTRDEAHQYLVMRHAHLHRHARLPAQVATELQLSKSRVPMVGHENVLVNLSISAEGRVDHIGSDGEAIAPMLAPELLAALREVRFLPALVDGKPVASTGSFALGELLR